MYIKRVLHLSSDDDEADIYVSDSQYELLCYANPAGALLKTGKVTAIWGFMCGDVVRGAESRASVTKLQEYYAYSVTGKVMSRGESIIQLGDIPIHLDTAIPGDIRKGEYVTVTVLRLDVC